VTWTSATSAGGSRAPEKTRRGRFVPVDGVVFDAVLPTQARENHDPQAPLFPGCTSERLRTAIAKACAATGVPLFSPHDLRHRRISLWHRAGIPWGSDRPVGWATLLSVTADTYTHVLTDDAEIDRFQIVSDPV
jgi:integrase